jgi:hypothetical protein
MRVGKSCLFTFSNVDLFAGGRLVAPGFIGDRAWNQKCVKQLEVRVRIGKEWL